MRVNETDFADVAKKYDMSEKDVFNIYKDTFEFIHKKASALDIFELQEKGIESQKTSFNLPGLGKLFVNEYSLNKLAKAWKK